MVNRDATHAWPDTSGCRRRRSRVLLTMEDAPKPKSLQLNYFLFIQGSWLDLLMIVAVVSHHLPYAGYLDGLRLANIWRILTIEAAMGNKTEMA